MKYQIALLLVLFPALVMAQSDPPLASDVHNLFLELKDAWTLGIDSNSNTPDISVYNRYKSLFDVNAKVDDDLNFQFVPGRGVSAYQVSAMPKEFDVYAHDAALEISKLRVDSVEQEENLGMAGQLVYELTRTIYVEKPARYVLQDVDSLAGSILGNHSAIKFERKGEKAPELNRAEILGTLKAKLRRDPDSVYKFYETSSMRITLVSTGDPASPLKIMRIQQLHSTVRCVNDDDGDGVLNPADSLRNIYGDFTATGAPDDDLDAVQDGDDRCTGTYGSVQNRGCPESYFFNNEQLDGCVGVQFNSLNISLPELNELGYRNGAGASSTDVLQSRSGRVANPTPVFGIHTAGNFVHFFGSSARRVGISAGFGYSRFVSSYQLADSIIYTYKSSDGHDSYRRQITIGSLSERIGYNVINIPVELSYRFKPRAIKKLVITLRAGPSFMLITGSSDYNATVDVGGIYQIDTVSKDKIAYYDYFDNQSTWNVYLTSSGINGQNSNPGAIALFDRLNSTGNYDFAANKVFRDRKKISRATWAINFSVDGQYKKSNNSPLAIKAGVHVAYAPSIGSTERYRPIERTTDDYNSVFNSNGNSFYLAYGLNLGLVYDF